MQDASDAKVCEVLNALLQKVPTAAVLDNGDYEDALQAQLDEAPDSPVGALARKVCAEWKRHAEAKGAEAMALLKGYEALAKLQADSTAMTPALTGACIDIE